MAAIDNELLYNDNDDNDDNVKCDNDLNDDNNDNDDNDDNFTEARSYTSDDSEEDCDCHEDYVCEWHSYLERHDALYKEALYVFKKRCELHGPNPSKHYKILSNIFIPVMNENMISMKECEISDVCFISLFINTIMFAISEPALNNTKYHMFIMNMFKKTRELRELYPSNRYIQRIYHKWSQFILNVK